MQQKVGIVIVVVALAGAACSRNTTQSAVAPSTFAANPIEVSPPEPVSIQIAGIRALFEAGQTVQLTANVVLSNGLIQNRTQEAAWTSSNPPVASVSSTGLVTAGAEGEATITATYQQASGTLLVRVRHGFRTPDPPPGQQLPLPNMSQVVFAVAAQYPTELRNSCQEPQFGGDPVAGWAWMDLLVDRLREHDLRWGYMGNTFDKIAYHSGAGDPQNSTDVRVVDVIGDHCGGNPHARWLPFTPDAGAFWTSRGRF